MIDFRINNIGDIELSEPDTTYPKFKINMTTDNHLPKFRLIFRSRARRVRKKSRIFKINMFTDKKQATKKHIASVSGTEEKSQSIAIRLKTELGELQDFFADFGSELSRFRHQDIRLTEQKKDIIASYVEKSISDIFKSSDINIDVKRVEPEKGNFKLETLKITISDKNGKIIYSYSF